MEFEKHVKCPNCNRKGDDEGSLGYKFQGMVNSTDDLGKCAEYKCDNCKFSAHYDDPEDVPEDFKRK
jgi:tRNA(Ile2) C34 agmatinyltransferase TiaS